MNYTFNILDNEYWWGGSSDDGLLMPLDKNSEYKNEFREVAPN